jgi:hypothetical protein
MDQLNYHCSININIPVRKAFESVSNGISAWWEPNFEGSAQNLDDVFTVSFGESAVTIQIVGIVPLKKILWRVVDCTHPWLNGKAEWRDTKIVWEFRAGNNSTHIGMTHIGLIPQIKCYTDSALEWDFLIKEKLAKLLSQSNTLPEVADSLLVLS